MHPPYVRPKKEIFKQLVIACSLFAMSMGGWAAPRESLTDLVGYPGFETLRSALEVASLLEVLEQRNILTLFAPSNEAFETLASELGCESVEELLSDMDAVGVLDEVLRDHLTAGRLSSQEVLMRGVVELISGRTAEVRVGARGISVAGAFNNMPRLSAPAITAELIGQNGNALAMSGIILTVDPTGLCDFDATAEVDKVVSVSGNREVFIAGHDSLAVGLDRDQAIGGDDEISVGKDRVANVGGDESLSIGSDREQSVGGNESFNVRGSRALTVGKDQTEQVGGARSQEVGADDTLDVGKNLVVEAGDSITIKTGKASITMTKDGNIAIKGKDISVDGSGKITIKSSGELVLKGSKILQN